MGFFCCFCFACLHLTVPFYYFPDSPQKSLKFHLISFQGLYQTGPWAEAQPVGGREGWRRTYGGQGNIWPTIPAFAPSSTEEEKRRTRADGMKCFIYLWNEFSSSVLFIYTCIKYRFFFVIQSCVDILFTHNQWYAVFS